MFSCLQINKWVYGQTNKWITWVWAGVGERLSMSCPERPWSSHVVISWIQWITYTWLYVLFKNKDQVWWEGCLFVQRRLYCVILFLTFRVWLKVAWITHSGSLSSLSLHPSINLSKASQWPVLLNSFNYYSRPTMQLYINTCLWYPHGLPLLTSWSASFFPVSPLMIEGFILLFGVTPHCELILLRFLTN